MATLEQIEGYAFSEYDWRERLQKTPQEKEYHGEGDVWTHTKLVIENLLQDDDYGRLPGDAQKIILLAAILHDIGKPFCTKTLNGKITSRHHAVRGAMEARKLIYRYGFMEELFGRLSFAEREQVCSMVRYHGLPLMFLEKADTEKAICRASLEVNPEYLYILAKADAKGRISKDKKSNLETIELFKEYCTENDCFTQPKHFPNSSGKLLYFKDASSYTGYAPYEKDKFPVYMMCGIPASGKDTYIEENLEGISVVSLDAIRQEMGVSPQDNQGLVVQAAKAQAKKLLAKKQSFVWNAVNITEKRRRPLVDLFTAYNAFVEVIYTEVPVPELFQRNKLRERTVPENIIEKLIDTMEVPKLWESHQVRYSVC
ncbi:MAG: AAA family ATPase [Spirochaetes bacterium]|nr:AAA family ATPase [Spirochaetota bacterium]